MPRFIGFYDYTVILTYMSLVSSFLGMILARREAFGAAIICLVVSGICDAFDGAVARTKKNRTEDEKAFGIQLDSLVDVVSFGVFPAFLCHCMGIRSIAGILLLCGYCVCAVIRLAFFNVLEAKRQKTEGGSNKVYRGLPVTSMSILLPAMFLFRGILPPVFFQVLLHLLPVAVGFLFVLDIPVKKPSLKRLAERKRRTEAE